MYGTPIPRRVRFAYLPKIGLSETRLSLGAPGERVGEASTLSSVMQRAEAAWRTRNHTQTSIEDSADACLLGDGGSRSGARPKAAGAMLGDRALGARERARPCTDAPHSISLLIEGLGNILGIKDPRL